MRADQCRKGCCWNPYGTCGRNRGCRCHRDATHADYIQQQANQQQALRDETHRRATAHAIQQEDDAA